MSRRREFPDEHEQPWTDFSGDTTADPYAGFRNALNDGPHRV